MDKRKLGRSGLSIAPMVFGGNVFGWTADEPTSFAMLDRFVELAAPDNWLDPSLRDRFHELLQRAEARLHPADEGAIPTLFETAADVEDASVALV